MLERRQRRGRQVAGIQRQTGRQLGVHDSSERRVHTGGVRPGQLADMLTDHGPCGLTCDPRRFPRRQPAQGGQEGPLIIEWLQRAGIKEHGQAVLAPRALQRCRNEVSRTVTRQHILGWEQPVVGTQIHGASQHGRFMDECRRDRPRRHSRNVVGEDDPHVRALARLGDLQRRRNAIRAGRFDVRKRVKHRRRTIKIHRDKPTCVRRCHRVQPDEQPAIRQVLGHDRRCQLQTGSLRPPHPLAPPTRHGGHPALRPPTRVLPPNRVGIGAGAKHVHEQRNLHRRRRSHRHRPMRRRRGQLFRRR